jgi:hypothetical protein
MGHPGLLVQDYVAGIPIWYIPNILPFLFLFWIVVALTMANALISALEVELNAARETWEGANAAKVSAEKVAKSAETKAKKAEKALADADQRQI